MFGSSAFGWLYPAGSLLTTVYKAGADAGAGTEIALVSYQPTVTDLNGPVTETVSVATQAADSGNFTDTATVAVKITVGDPALRTYASLPLDFATYAAIPAQVPTYAKLPYYPPYPLTTETVSVTANLAAVDLGTASESASVTFITADTGSSAEISAVKVLLSVTDTGAAAEIASVKLV